MKTHLTAAIKTGSLLLLFVISVFSCKKETSGSVPAGHTGIKLFLTDDPSLLFDAVFIDIQKLEVKVEDSSQAKQEDDHSAQVDDDDHRGVSGGGWMTLDIHPGVYNILKFRNGLDTLFAAGSFPSHLDLRKLRLTLGSANSVMYDGQTFPLVLKNEDRFVVVKMRDFNIELSSPDALNLWLDFDAGRSIRKHGNDFELRSEIRLFTKEKAGSIEGRVLPAEAGAVVMAINGSDTLSAKPEREGEFKFVGLKAGTYSLVFHATANNYKDTTVQAVRVAAKEDTHINNIVLHK